MTFFSIITSCYNSCATLERTFNSLSKQTFQDFEWILVDDFSSDENKTRELIMDIKHRARFKIKYYFLEKNYFASRSIMTACKLSIGKYIVNLDHDDQFLPDTLRIAKEYIDKFCNADRIAGICGRCIDLHGNMLGKPFAKNCFEEHMGSVVFKMKSPELIHFSKREVIEKIAFLMKPGYTYGFIWAEISKNYNYIYTNEILRIYDTELETSYTNKPKSFLKYPHNRVEALKHFLICYRNFLKYDVVLSVKTYLSYIRFCLVEKLPIRYIIKDFNLVMKIILLFLLPFGFILHNMPRFTFDERLRN